MSSRDSEGHRRLSAVEEQEHRANLARWKRAYDWGMVMWPGFALVDWLMAKVVGLASLAFLLGIRFSLTPFHALIYWRLHREPEVGPRMLRFFDLFAFGTATGAIALMSTRLGGFESLYFGGIIVAVVCRSAFVVEPWRRGLASNGFMVATWVAVLFVASLFDENLARQVRQTRSMGIFAVQFGFVASVALLSAWGSHSLWALRRQVFADRYVGRYRLKERIGKGGMGEVWVAWHGALKRNVAIKLLKPEVAEDPAAVERFEREVAATTQLQHPNTVRIFDYGVTEDGIWYYVMELLEGRTLADLVKEEGPLDQERAVHIALQAARALAEAHEHGIVHRDIKPENVFVCRAGGDEDIVKMLDFGIAKWHRKTDDAHLTQTGAVLGTPAYMSPEAVRGVSIGPRSDVYSLGAVLYFMLTGRPPLPRDSLAELLVAHLHEQPEPIEAVRGRAVDPELERIVLRCLEKRPEDRYPNALCLAEDLEACLVELRARTLETHQRAT